MMLDLATFKLEHLNKFEARSDIIINVSDCCKLMLESSSFVMFSVMSGDLPVLIICVQYITANVGEVIVYPSKDFTASAKYLKTFFANSNNFLDNVIDKLSLTRLQASVDKSKPKFIKWIEGFGFEREGVMRGFGPESEDYYLYSYLGGGQ